MKVWQIVFAALLLVLAGAASADRGGHRSGHYYGGGHRGGGWVAPLVIGAGVGYAVSRYYTPYYYAPPVIYPPVYYTQPPVYIERPQAAQAECYRETRGTQVFRVCPE